MLKFRWPNHQNRWLKAILSARSNGTAEIELATTYWCKQNLSSRHLQAQRWQRSMLIPRSLLVWDKTGAPNNLHEIIASSGRYSSNTSQNAWSGSTSSAMWIQKKTLDQLMHNLIQSHSWAVTQLVKCTCKHQWDLVHLPISLLECCSILSSTGHNQFFPKFSEGW